MVRRAIYLILAMGLIGVSGWAQAPQPIAPNENEMYCGGIPTTATVPTDTYVISGPESDVRPVFTQGQKVFINRGANKGVKVGDQFQVTRVASEQLRYPWFAWQESLMQAMGTFHQDVGRLRVVSVQPKTAIAEIVLSCDYIERGDIVEPFVPRPAPAFKAIADLDQNAAPSGKAKAMIVYSQNFGQLVAAGKTVYVNLGVGQGVKVGDYFRVFKYQGEHDDTAYNTTGNAYRMFGLGATPVPYGWEDLPRDILGEGVVVRVSPSAAVVLITKSQREMHVGDYVEME